jgi:hypothetical protein
MHQLPRTPVFQRFGIVSIVIGQSLFQVLRLAYVEAVRRFAPEDINIERHKNTP